MLDYGLDFFEAGVDAFGALFFSGFERSGVGAELVKELEGLSEGGVDGGFVLGKLLRGWGSNDWVDVALEKGKSVTVYWGL